MVISKFKATLTWFVLLLLTTSTVAWKEDFNKCNIGRAFGRGSDACAETGPQMVEMVSAT